MRFFVPLLLAGSASAQLTAIVNDANSHGTVGDSLLSLQEAIQVANGTLLIPQLSAAEQAQLQGVSGAVERIEIRAATTPTITLQRQLDYVTSLPHAHVHLEIEGVSNAGAAPVIQAGTVPVALPLSTNHAHVHNLTILGGQVGITYETLRHFHPGEYGEVGEVDLDGQTTAAIQIFNPRTVPGQQAPFILHEVHIHDVPVGIEIIDDSSAGNIDVSGEHVHIEHCDVGIRVAVDSVGSDNLLTLMHTEIDAHETAIAMHRVTPASTGRWQVRMVHGSIRAMDCAFDLQGNAAGTTNVALHHLDVRAGVSNGACALTAGPQAAHLNLTATETHFFGPVAFAAGAANSALRLHNDRLEAGAVTLNVVGGGAADVLWTNFTAAPVTAAATTAVALGFDSCEFVRSGITDLSPGRVQLTNCFLGDSPLTGNIANQRPQLNPWIGRASVSPTDPPVGTYTDLNLDLQPGTAAIWVLGLLDPAPITTATPFRFYLNLNAILVLPGLHTLTSRVRLPIPPVNALRNSTFYLQPVQVPTQGQAGVPALYLPIGSALQAL